ncbi:hypothetical protein [Stenotrophomonas sp. AB1(2024)]|uniref:hypothetical protein n=1 Tax=Stenotrophomonas sp. AB1(2024) TaxID=3132215 RepID=UPI0030B481C2
MNHMDELAQAFVEECHERSSFAAAIRVLDDSNVRIICRKVPMGALASLLRKAADICDKQADTDRLN